MKESAPSINEQAAAHAFSKQAPLFDALYSNDSIIQYKRRRVRDHVMTYLRPQSKILELNAGTGEDAIFFAQQGHLVHATDISSAMQTILKEKVVQQKLEDKVTHEVCSFTDLENLQHAGPYDMIFSNFAGLNCSNELEKVLHSFSFLLKPGATVTLVILPKFCLWEFSLAFKGKFRTAFRRFSGRRGTKAHIEGEYFRCWYYNPSFIIKRLRSSFETLALEGLCTLVPPSYIENFSEKHPKLFGYLRKKENDWKSKWPWRSIGDYYIITLRKKD